VEVFLGGKSGKMSVASRKSKAVVSIFENYKFKSDSYYNIRHHYHSLDTWLNGILSTNCDIHSKKNRNKKSIKV